jgi:hypothetical protein
VADSIPWGPIQQAIFSWVTAGASPDVAAGGVFWTHRKQARPPAPFIALTIRSVRPVGHDWTLSEINGLVLPTQTVASVNVGASTLRVNAHPFSNGDGPVQVGSSGTLPGGLAALTDYWVVVVDANTIQLATSYQLTGGQQPLGTGNPVTPVTLSSGGSGTITLVTTPDSLPAGKEVVRRAQGYREVVLQLVCVGADGSGVDAVRIMANVAASLQLHLYDLDQAGVGVSDLGQAFSQGGVQAVDGHRGPVLEPRSTWEMTFDVASDLTGFDTVIEEIDGNVELQTPDGTSLPAVPFKVSLT